MNFGRFMKLTITISNWNRDWFLDRSIYLLSKQTMSQEDWELIIVDDGSTDQTDMVINRYKELNVIKNFHYIKRIVNKKKYGNCAIARNIGARYGTGDYIIFTDPEVMVMPDWSEQHYLAHKRKLINSSSEYKFSRPGGGFYRFDDSQSMNEICLNDDTTDRNVIGLCLQPRIYHVIDCGNEKLKNCRGSFLGDAYTDYNWFDIEETWRIMEEKIKKVQKEFGLTDKQIRDEFYIYQATQAGHSVSRSLFYEIGGFEEDYANAELGLDKWAGEDTWFRYCLVRFNSLLIHLEDAKAIHIYHTKECSDSDAVNYAAKYAADYPDRKYANVGRKWGQIEENGFEVIF